jgi:aspartyl protease
MSNEMPSPPLTMDLPGFLASRGFHRVPLTRSGLGHFHAAGTLKGRDITVLVDTGASNTLVAMALVQEMGLDTEATSQRGGGAGGADLEILIVRGADLWLGDVRPRPSALFAMDLTHVNQALTMRGEGPVDAVLGADVFESQSAVVDYGSSSLYLLP